MEDKKNKPSSDKPREWTKSQKAAIDSRGRSLMISAGAGSGKTATLTERIVSLISDGESPADIGSILAVTFTNKAAGELRERITAAISRRIADDPTDRHMLFQLSSVGGADICTIDSYYLKLVKNNFQRLGIPSTIRLIEPEESDAMREKIVADVVERFFGTDPLFDEFADSVCGGNLMKLPEVLSGICSDLADLPDPFGFLEGAADRLERFEREGWQKAPSGKLFFSAVREKTAAEGRKLRRHLEKIRSEGGCVGYAGCFECCAGFTEAVVSAIDAGAPYAELRDLVLSFTSPDIGRAAKGTPEREKKPHKDAKESFDDFVRKMKTRFFWCTEDEIGSAHLKTAAMNRLLSGLAKEIDKAFSGKKNELGVADFSDIRRYVLRLLDDGKGNPTDVALEERKRYSHVFVDEYQDTDEIQDRIFNLISRGDNLFIVGDVKQSIYGFRGARPDIFANYRKSCAPVSEAESGNRPAGIYMSENFRCSRQIIDFTNVVCGFLFGSAEKKAGDGRHGFGYRKEDELIFRSGREGTPRVRFTVSTGNPPEPGKRGARASTGIKANTCFIVSEIERIALRRSRDGKTPAWGDVAVLSRKNADLSVIGEALAARGIPYSNPEGSELLDNPEITMFYTLLSTIDNPVRDVPLAGTLRSPLFGFSVSDLVSVRLGRTDSPLWEALCDYPRSDVALPSLAALCSDAVGRINRFRELASELPVDRFIRILWKETEADSYSGSSGGNYLQSPLEKQARLKRLYDLARSFGGREGGTLHDFISYIGTLVSKGKSIGITPVHSDNSVTLLSIHKSKGLEFPAVILTGVSQKLKLESGYGSLLTSDPSFGFLTDFSDPTGLTVKVNPFLSLFRDIENDRSCEEYIRLLYVALTRAKEELIIAANGTPDYPENLDILSDGLSAYDREETVYSAPYFDRWILTALKSSKLKTDGLFTAEDGPTDADAERTAPGRKQISGPSYTRADVEKYERIFSGRFAFGYGWEKVSGIPAKLSVSALYPDILTESEPESSDVFSLRPTTPRFLGDERAGADEKGTATHVFLQFCDFSSQDGSSGAVEKEIKRLLERSFISGRTASLINRNELSRFFGSAFFKEVRAAKSVWREKRFNVLIDASVLSASPERRRDLAGEKVLVQGVMDILLEMPDGSLVLCDYKTDRLTKEDRSTEQSVARIMRQRHGEQLGYYAQAVASLFGKAPSRILVFPLCYGEAVDITGTSDKAEI